MQEKIKKFKEILESELDKEMEDSTSYVNSRSQRP